MYLFCNKQACNNEFMISKDYPSSFPNRMELSDWLMEIQIRDRKKGNNMLGIDSIRKNNLNEELFQMNKFKKKKIK